MPTFIVAFIANQGKLSAHDYYGYHLKLQDLCAEVGLKLLSTGADGAKSEFNAHKLLRATQADSPLVYTNAQFLIDISCPVWNSTGPLIPISDPPHARKGMKNALDSGTHLLTLGDAYVCHGTMMDLLRYPKCPLYMKDIYNSDKQDDACGRRILHGKPLAMLVTDNGQHVDEAFTQPKPQMRGSARENPGVLPRLPVLRSPNHVTNTARNAVSAAQTHELRDINTHTDVRVYMACCLHCSDHSWSNL